MLARPAAIAAMPVVDRFTSRAVRDGAAARVAACRVLRCEGFASALDCTENMLAGRGSAAV
jgi:hypothetical protein